MSYLRMIYLGLALWGAIHPAFHLLQWIMQHGADLSALVAAWKSNAASKALYWDLLIASLALNIWILAEVAVRRNWSALIAIPVTYSIGLGCGLPLYLFLRTRPVV